MTVSLDKYERQLDPRFLDKVTRTGPCPGFYVYDVVATNGRRYIVAADFPGSAQTRVYLRSNGHLDVLDVAENVRLLGSNDYDVARWHALRK